MIYTIANRGLGADAGFFTPAAAAPPAPGQRGLFASGLDLNGWGLAEWAIAAAVLYFAWRLVGDVKGGVRRVRQFHKRRQRKGERRAELRKELALI